MDKFVIHGGNRLSGTVTVSGAKNAVLPVMAACLLASGKFTIRNVPDLRDVKTMAHLLRIIGARVEFSDNRLSIETSNCNFFEAPYELVRTMRASIYVLGPLVARYHQAKVSLPGGCALGPRPVNLHMKGLEQMGAELNLENGYIHAKTNGLRGARINFDTVSVGATAQLLMAAVLSRGRTVLENAAREPEVTALADFLVKMGAQIEGIGTSQLRIEGVKTLKPVDFEIIPDRIETGTFMIGAAITGGEIEIAKTRPEFVSSLSTKLREAGVFVEEGETSIHCKASGCLDAVNITTSPYPGFPTDLQAQWMSLMTIATGNSVINETIFSDRFMHIAELRRLGAEIDVNENTAVVKGVKRLGAATVMSTDLRASACLILAGLVAEGCTDVLRVYHIDRGYERIEEKLGSLGAEIRREQDSN